MKRPLPPRLQQVLVCMSKGECEKRTARTLGLSYKTIKMHKKRLFKALEASNAPHAVAIGYQSGLLQIEIAA